MNRRMDASAADRGALARWTRPLQRLAEADTARPGFAYEHWLVLGAGVGLLLGGIARPQPLQRSTLMLLGAALIARSASGRDGWARPLAGRDTDHHAGRDTDHHAGRDADHRAGRDGPASLQPWLRGTRRGPMGRTVHRPESAT